MTVLTLLCGACEVEILRPGGSATRKAQGTAPPHLYAVTTRPQPRREAASAAAAIAVQHMQPPTGTAAAAAIAAVAAAGDADAVAAAADAVAADADAVAASAAARPHQWSDARRCGREVAYTWLVCAGEDMWLWLGLVHGRVSGSPIRVFTSACIRYVECAYVLAIVDHTSKHRTKTEHRGAQSPRHHHGKYCSAYVLPR